MKAAAKVFVAKLGLKDGRVVIKNTFIDGYDEDGENNNDLEGYQSLPWNCKLPSIDKIQQANAAEIALKKPTRTAAPFAEAVMHIDTSVDVRGGGEMRTHTPCGMMPDKNPLTTNGVSGAPLVAPMAPGPQQVPADPEPLMEQPDQDPSDREIALLQREIAELEHGIVEGELAMAKRHGWTTLILRSIPNNYARQDLLDLLDERKLCYDFIHVPMHFDHKSNCGYAVVNATSPAEAQRVKQTLDGLSDWTRSPSSQQRLQVAWSEKARQGISTLIELHRDSPIMRDAVPDELKPAIFDNGQRVAFPAAKNDA